MTRNICTSWVNTRYQELIKNDNDKTEWSPIWFVITRVINKIERPWSGSLICLITSMTTDRIGCHQVLLSINHNYSKIWEKLQQSETCWCFIMTMIKKIFRNIKEFSVVIRNQRKNAHTSSMQTLLLAVYYWTLEKCVLQLYKK